MTQTPQQRSWISPSRVPELSRALVVAGTFVAILVRLPFLEILSHDIVGHLGQWYDYIVLNGGVRALGDRFADYTPAYLYLLTAAAYLREWVLPIISKVAAIKLPSIAADFVMALAVYKLARLFFRDSLKAAIAYVVALLLPTVVVNSAVWGQADSLYTLFVLWCVYFLCTRRPGLAMVMFGAGLTLKAQTVFIAPLLLFLLARRAMRWPHLLIAPAVYALVLAPAVLLGRPPLEALGSYLVQANEYRALSMGAPNLYLFVPTDLYHFGLPVGTVIAAIAGLTIAIVFILRSIDPSPDDILACTLVCVAVMPFVLPKMHERYFYPADVLAVLAALRWRRLWWLPVAYQFISLSAYASVLQALNWWNRILPGEHTFVWLNAFVVVVVAVSMSVTRRTMDALSRRRAGLALGGGTAAMLLVAAGAIALAPGNRRAPVWVGTAGSFGPANPTAITYAAATADATGAVFELLGYNLPEPHTYRTGIMKIDLYFTPLRPLAADYRLRVEGFAADGRSLELVDEQPALEAPLSTWQPGQVYLQRRFLTIWPTIDAPALATFKVSWIDPQTGQPLATRCGDAACDPKIGLVPIGLDYATAAPWLRAPARAFAGPGRALALLDATYAPRVSPGQDVVFTTTWRAEASPAGDLTLFVHVLAADGSMVAQVDAQPRGGLYPTHVWHRGEVVIDQRRVTLPVDLAPGEYQVVLGAYGSDSAQRVPATSASGAPLPDDVIPLGSLTVQR
jgi:Gpi18-like mannosyltransferase